MKDYLKLLRRNKFLVLMIILFPILLYIFGILVGKVIEEPIIIYSFSDIMAFYNGYLAFIGTVFLGVVAILQNQRANEISDKLLDLEVKRNNPVMRLLKFSFEKLDLNGIDTKKHGGINNWFFIGNGETGTKIGTINLEIRNITGLEFTKLFGSLKHYNLQDGDETITHIHFDNIEEINERMDIVLEHDEDAFERVSNEFAGILRKKSVDSWFMMLGVEGLSGERIYSFYRLSFTYREKKDKIFEVHSLDINQSDELEFIFANEIRIIEAP